MKSSRRAPVRSLYGGAILAGSLVAASIPAAALVGGALPAAEGTGRSVVMILGSYGTVCTASAIATDLLLTAAHCVQPGADYKLLASKPGDTPVLKDAARIERNPQFELKRLFAHRGTADVALIKLAEPLPARIPPLPIADEAITVAAGDRLTVAGYGVTARGDRRLDGMVRAASLVVTGRPDATEIRLVDPATQGLSAGLGACTGDSGAPALRESSSGPVIVGLVSWSTGPKLAGGCGGLTGITPLARYRAWIAATAQAMGSPIGGP